jgi:alpha/beta superfamily hydrolase
MHVNPFFFGTRERRLFGLYTPGRGGPGARAAVLCHPWGQEYLRAHRSVRHLATLLSRAGVHVLRFDYLGTGDSAGDLTDGDLAGWQRDVEHAIDELQETAGVARVGLVGLRLGAAIAAGVAARRRDAVDRLVLWDPVVDGAEYADDLSREATAHADRDGTVEVSGFLLTRRMESEIRALDLVALAPALPERTLVVASEPLPSHGSLRVALQGREFEEVASPAPWLEDRSTGVGAIPVPVLHAIARWWERP